MTTQTAKGAFDTYVSDAGAAAVGFPVSRCSLDNPDVRAALSECVSAVGGLSADQAGFVAQHLRMYAQAAALLPK